VPSKPAIKFVFKKTLSPTELLQHGWKFYQDNFQTLLRFIVISSSLAFVGAVVFQSLAPGVTATFAVIFFDIASYILLSLPAAICVQHSMLGKSLNTNAIQKESLAGIGRVFLAIILSYAWIATILAAIFSACYILFRIFPFTMNEILAYIFAVGLVLAIFIPMLLMCIDYYFVGLSASLRGMSGFEALDYSRSLISYNRRSFISMLVYLKAPCIAIALALRAVFKFILPASAFGESIGMLLVSVSTFWVLSPFNVIDVLFFLSLESQRGNKT